MQWIDHNKLFINWSKTKFFIVSKSSSLPNYIIINDDGCIKDCSSISLIGVEVVDTFKLLGVTIDDKLTFRQHIDITIKTINQKMFAIKKIFYLSYKIKLHFFKTFILPHFDYCSSLFIYLTKTIIGKLENCYNFCIFNLFNIELYDIDSIQQEVLLSPLKLMSFFHRFLIRFSIFTFKVFNSIILKDIKLNLTIPTTTTNLRSKSRRIFIVPFCNSLKCSRRLSIFFPKFCNNIITYSYLDSFNKCLAEFKNLIFTNIISRINEFKMLLFNN